MVLRTINIVFLMVIHFSIQQKIKQCILSIIARCVAKNVKKNVAFFSEVSRYFVTIL